METKRKKQSKARRCIGAPIRVLAKAGDFYMRSMMGCSGSIGLVGCPALQLSRLPNSFSVDSLRGRGAELGEVTGRVSKRSTGGSRIMPKMERRSGMGMRSYRVGLGRIGKIDEDKPCEFVEDDDDDDELRDHVLYPRSRSCAVAKRNAVFY